MTQQVHKRAEESSQNQRKNMEEIQTRSSVAGIHKGKGTYAIGYLLIIKTKNCHKKLKTQTRTLKGCST